MFTIDIPCQTLYIGADEGTLALKKSIAKWEMALRREKIIEAGSWNPAKRTNGHCEREIKENNHNTNAICTEIN